MKKIIATTIIATAFISLLFSANVKPNERKLQPALITTTTVKTDKEKITTEPITQPTTTTSITTTITSPVTTTAPETTTIVPLITTTLPITEQTTAITTTQPISTETTTLKNGTIEGDLIWIQGFGWVEYKGGGGIGYYDAEMYTNGNKIGYFG